MSPLAWSQLTSFKPFYQPFHWTKDCRLLQAQFGYVFAGESFGTEEDKAGQSSFATIHELQEMTNKLSMK